MRIHHINSKLLESTKIFKAQTICQIVQVTTREKLRLEKALYDENQFNNIILTNSLHLSPY